MNRTSIVTVSARFCGPTGIGNGGYVCGLMAEAIGGPARVRLRLPTPLDTPLTLECDGRAVRLRDGDSLLAEGIALDDAVDLAPPPRPSPAQIAEAAPHFPRAGHHMAPDCFVCGHARDGADALCIFAGRHPATGHALARWIPAADLADKAGVVATRYLWAALDCPSYFALGLQSRVALLADMAATIVRRPRPGEDLTVSGWTFVHDGRKHYSASVIHDIDGQPIALAKTLWIDVGVVGSSSPSAT